MSSWDCFNLLLSRADNGRSFERTKSKKTVNSVSFYWSHILISIYTDISLLKEINILQLSGRSLDIPFHFFYKTDEATLGKNYTALLLCNPILNSSTQFWYCYTRLAYKKRISKLSNFFLINGMLYIKIFGTNLGMFYFKAFWLFQNICSMLMVCVNFFCLYIHIRKSGQLPRTKCCNLNRRNSTFIKGFFQKKQVQYEICIRSRMRGRIPQGQGWWLCWMTAFSNPFNVTNTECFH